MKVLVVEDKKSLADIVSDKLKNENYEVDTIYDGLEAYSYAETGAYDLIVLDVMLPNMDGFEILNKLRRKNINTKIIMLTAKSTLNDKLKGLTHGANDYLTKPFHLDELVARVNVLLGTNNNNTNLKQFGDIELDISNSNLKCTKTNKDIDLVKKELQLFEYFINNKGQILKKNQIYDKIWGMYTEIESNNLEAYLSFIRRKLKAIGSNTNIKAVRGLGYKMVYNNESSKK